MDSHAQITDTLRLLLTKLNTVQEMWTDFEDMLLKSPPQDLECRYDTIDNDGQVEHHWLGLQTHNGQSRLCHGIEQGNDLATIAWTPIADCDEQTQVDATDGLRLLIDEHWQNLPDELIRVEEAIEALAEAIALVVV